MNPKVILSVVGVAGGGSCVVPVILWQIGNLGATRTQTIISSHSSRVNLPSGAEGARTILEQNSVSTEKTIKQENCRVTDSLGKEILEKLNMENDTTYVAISCDNTDEITNQDKIIPNEWVGFFPTDLFLVSFQLDEGKKLNIKTQTTKVNEENEEFKTIFQGDKFMKPSITGSWGSEEQSSGDKKITKFKFLEEGDQGLFETDSFYLWFPETKKG